MRGKSQTEILPNLSALTGTKSLKSVIALPSAASAPRRSRAEGWTGRGRRRGAGTPKGKPLDMGMGRERGLVEG